ncbi:MAG: chemotaxis protein CheA [Bryobacteraceae bacterium]
MAEQTIPASAPPPALAQDPELIADFLLESREHLSAIEASLLVLERDPEDREAIHAAFRSFHTIKGLAGFLEFTGIHQVAHEVETALDLARDGQLRIGARVIDVILEAADYVAQFLKSLEAPLDGRPPMDPGGNSPLIARVRDLQSIPEKPGSAGAIAEQATGEERVAADLGVLAQSTALAPPAVAEEIPRAEARGPAARSVKVDTRKLDYLVDMVGEMVIAQSLVSHDPSLERLSRPALTRNLTQLARITEEVQRTAMALRMVPVGQLFHKMTRVVRDLARKTGKQAELEMVGGDTELDRNLVEELGDPLMHMIRNSLDHGIESPSERMERGKPPVGRVRLAASHQAGHILVEVSDDGRGLNRERILRKAESNGLVKPGAHLSDTDIFHLIFQPGFSTAQAVTDVSGRGVGMDVVRRHVQKLRGRIEIRSTAGRGATFYLKLPLTLAIIDGLVVGVGGQRYILPVFAVREVLQPVAGMLSTVENRAEVAQVRGALLPVVRLYRRFAVTPRSEQALDGVLIVAESANRRFALLVDEVIGKQEVVIKSLGETMQNIPGIAGGAILGDGRVGLILDLEGVFGAKADE